MRIKPPTEPHRSELSVVPLVNIVFLLLIFFMLVGQVSSPEPLNVEPPRSASGKEDTGQTVKILLTRDGRIAMDQAVIARSDLDQRVADVLSRRPDASFQIKADARVDAVAMIRTMEQLRDAGVERLSLLTERGGLP